MDFWSRLIGGAAGASAFKKRSTSDISQQRLARFRRIYGQLQQRWRASTSVAAERPSAENIYIELQRLNSILREETGVAAPHECLAYASSERVYDTISNVALMYHHEGSTREAVVMFNSLLESEEEEIVGDAGFAKSMMTFMSKATGVGVQAEGDIVELLFAIATKIRHKPDTLPVWFIPKRNNGNHANVTDPGEAPYDDFPLFYLLLHFVHHEGSVGDFARTGLLYLIEAASHSEVLEGWLMESDLATLMASGLGALYSQLSRKLVVSFSKEDMPAVLALSDLPQAQTIPEAEISTSPEFRTHVNTFLSYLLFWQDILERCQSAEVKQTLLDHFQILFLQQLLYPSLLESSDIDGGSSVAVITYLRRILESISHPELIGLILQYLFASSYQTNHEQTPLPQDRLSASRRRSLDQLTYITHGEDKPSPSLFNLGDLVLTSMRSRSQSTVAATLKLVSVLIQKHHQHTINSLLRTSPAVPSASQRTIGAHNKEMELLFLLVENLCKDDNADGSYENYLQDTRDLLECHPCTTQLLTVHTTDSATATPSATSTPKGSRKNPHLHILKLDDPLLTAIMALLETFLTNSAETNLNLTEVVIALASCGYVLVEGWLVVNPSNYIYDEDSGSSDTEEDTYHDSDLALSEQLEESIENERNQILALRKARRQPFWSAEDTSPVVASLQSLIHQVSLYRKEVPNFDTYLKERKETFQVEEKLTEALASIPPPIRSSQDSASFYISSALSTDPGLPGLISQRILPEKVSALVSGSSSPRGGQQSTPQATPPISTLGQLNLKGPNLLAQTIPRAFSPSPLRPDLFPSPPSHIQWLKSADIDVLKRKVDMATSKGPVAKILAEDQGSSETSSLFSNSTTLNNTETVPVEVSVSHLLTNVVLLQEFILELAAVIQVRASLFEEVKFEQCYDNLRISNNAWDTNLVKVNPQYISVNWQASGGGAFAVIPINEKGKLPEQLPLFRGHTAPVLDTDWSPFNDSFIASGSDDAKVFLWKVPEGFTLHTDAEEPQSVSPVAKLVGHSRKVGHVLFNPAAENILATSSGDYTIKLWDVEAQSPRLTLKHGDIVQSLSWSANGSLLVTTSRDKKLRIWDVRQEKPAHEVPGHSGAKNSRAVWMGEHDRVATTGFSKMSDRQLALWDIRTPKEPIGGFQVLDSISGVCMPFWDEGTQCLYLAGKGDGNIRYFEYEHDKFEFLSEYKSAEPQRGIAFLPKRGVNIHDNEVIRAFKTVNDSYIEPISFIVPRRAEVFQSDIYPPTIGIKPAMSAAEWFDGKEALPPKIDLESVYDGEEPTEVPATSKPAVTQARPLSPKVPSPTKKETEQPKETTSSTVASRAPPPSMKAQQGSIAALASKFADDDDASEEEDDDSSSFEEVSKPMDRSEKTAPVSASHAEKTPPPALNKAAEADQPTTKTNTSQAAAQFTHFNPLQTTHEDAMHTSSKQPSVPAQQAQPKSPQSSQPSISSGSAEPIHSYFNDIKRLLEQQTQTMAAQSEKIGLLTAEVDTLKTKIGESSLSSGRDRDREKGKDERIRELELELEVARS